jgi:hypothetical protein
MVNQCGVYSWYMLGPTNVAKLGKTETVCFGGTHVPTG